MIGSYAILLRTFANDSIPSLLSLTTHYDSEDELIFDSLKNFGVALLSKETLEISVPFRITDFDTASVKIYHVLFSYDTDILPWNYSYQDHTQG